MMSSSYYDYGYQSADLANAAIGGLFAGAMLIYWLIALAVGILVLVATWKMFTKAGKPGWAAIIPIYNTIVMLQIAGMSPWMVLLMFIPIANIIVMILMYVKLAEKFGKGGGYAVGLIFLPYVFIPMLAWGNAEYQG